MIQITIINIIIEALRNYGYRCVGKKDTNIIFAKPIGYAIVKAEIIQNKSNFKLEMSLIIKNTDGENTVFTSANYMLKNIEDNEEYYLNVIQIIMDFEADILANRKLTYDMNYNTRFDFIENTKCLNEYIF